MLVTFFAKAYDPATASSDLGIPYLTQPQKIVDGSYTRGTVASVYANIEKDLKEGIPLIKDESYKVPKYHFNSQAAHAFATRFYLFKKEYKKVIEHANAAFPGTTISDNLRPWNTIYISLGAIELEVRYTNSTEPANLLVREAASSWCRSFSSYNYGLTRKTYLSMVGKNNPTGLFFAMINHVYSFGGEIHHIPKFKEHFVKNSISASIGNPFIMVPLFTSEEVLFSRAEASVREGNYTQALADIDAYLSTRLLYYEPSKLIFTINTAKNFINFRVLSERDALIESILLFRKIEYIHEGLRWFDIIRLKKTVKHYSVDEKIKIDLDADDPRKALQIPQEAIKIGLEPNPR